MSSTNHNHLDSSPRTCKPNRRRGGCMSKLGQWKKWRWGCMSKLGRTGTRANGHTGKRAHKKWYRGGCMKLGQTGTKKNLMSPCPRPYPTRGLVQIGGVETWDFCINVRARVGGIGTSCIETLNHKKFLPIMYVHRPFMHSKLLSVKIFSIMEPNILEYLFT